MGIWARRSNINLLGAHIDVFSGEWTQKVAFLLIVYVTKEDVLLFSAVPLPCMHDFRDSNIDNFL